MSLLSRPSRGASAMAAVAFATALAGSGSANVAPATSVATTQPGGGALATQHKGQSPAREDDDANAAR